MDTSSQNSYWHSIKGEMVKVLRSKPVLDKDPDEVIAMGARGEIPLYIYVNQENKKFIRPVKSLEGMIDGVKFVDTEGLLKGLYCLYKETLEKFIEANYQPITINLEYKQFLSDYDKVPFSQKGNPYICNEKTIYEFYYTDICFLQESDSSAPSEQPHPCDNQQNETCSTIVSEKSPPQTEDEDPIKIPQNPDVETKKRGHEIGLKNKHERERIQKSEAVEKFISLHYEYPYRSTSFLISKIHVWLEEKYEDVTQDDDSPVGVIKISTIKPALEADPRTAEILKQRKKAKK